MKTIIVFLLLCHVCCACNGLKSDSQIRRCMDLMFRHDYSSALALCDSLKNAEPGEPAGYCMQYIILQYQLLDLFSNSEWGNAERVFKEAERVIRVSLGKNPENIDALFHRAAIYGAHSYMLIKFGHSFKGFRDGLKSTSIYKKILKKFPDCCDARGALGTYYYWKGVYLDFLPFFENDRKSGIEMLKQAASCSSYYQAANIYSYLWVKFNEHQYGEALEISEQALIKYPLNRSFLRSRADCLFELKRWDMASVLYDSLAAAYGGPGFSQIQVIEVMVKIAYIHKETGKNKKAMDVIEKILAMPVNSWEKEFVKKQLAWAGNLGNELKEMSRALE